MSRSKAIVAAASAILLLGCDLPFGSSHRSEVAVIPGPMLVRPYLQLPDTVAAGAVFQIVLTTVGPNGCYSAADTEVDVMAGVVRITPYHRVTPGMCTQAPVELARSIELPALARGVTSIHVNARSDYQDAGPTILRTKDVVVR